MRRVQPEDDVPVYGAAVARLPKDDGTTKSAVLVPPRMGYLAVRVQFHGIPVHGLKVHFGKIDSAADDSPEKMEPELISAEDGLAFFPRLVPEGLYSCHVERQPSTVVPTSVSLDEPYPVILPVGRPLVDLGDVEEFRLKVAPS